MQSFQWQHRQCSSTRLARCPQQLCTPHPCANQRTRSYHLPHSSNRDVASTAALQETLSTTAAAEHTEAAVVATTIAAANPSAQTSKCPLFSASAPLSPAKDSQAVKELLRDLPHGPGWAVIDPSNVDGEDFSMPLPEGRFCWNPLVGEILELSSKGMGPFLLERYQEFGPVFTWQMGTQKMISVLDYETIRSIMQHDSKVVKAWSSESIYAILGEMTRVQFENTDKRMVARKMNAPGFTPQALADYIPKIVSITSAQLDEWASAGSFDLARDTKDLSFEFSTQLLVNFAIPRAQKAMLREKFDRMFNAMSALPIKLPGTTYTRGIEAREEVIQDIKQLLVMKRQQQQQQGASSSSSSNSSDRSDKGCVLDTMMESFKYIMNTDTLSDDEIASTGVALIIAGNDTSGLGIMGMLGLLALTPQVMDKLRQEQQQVLLHNHGDYLQVMAVHGDAINRHSLDAMPYADAVAKEALRITPPAPQLFRRTLVDMQIGGKFVPAGSILSLAFYIAQMLTDPALHKLRSSSSDGSSILPVPAHQLGVLPGQVLQQEFNPDRWLTHSHSSTSSSSTDLGRPSGLLTFGTGRHECLGRGLFMNEAKVLLALLARKYDLTLEKPEDFAFRMGFSVVPQEGCVVQVHARA